MKTAPFFISTLCLLSGEHQSVDGLVFGIADRLDYDHGPFPIVHNEEPADLCLLGNFPEAIRLDMVREYGVLLCVTRDFELFFQGNRILVVNRDHLLKYGQPENSTPVEGVCRVLVRPDEGQVYFHTSSRVSRKEPAPV